MKHIAIIVILFNLFACDLASPMKMKGMEVLSPPAKVGGTLCFRCLYELEKGEKLIGIEWIKDKRPFYHFTRGAASISNNYKSKPFKMMFGSNSFVVNPSKSDHNTVTLNDITASAAGEYSCVVQIFKPEHEKHISKCSVDVAPKKP